MLLDNAAKIEKKVVNIIKKHSLSNTETRRYVLTMFLTSNKAISHGDIEKQAADKLDRVTVYRTLQVFLEKHIIHSIPTNDNRILYALCNHDANSITEKYLYDDHVHVDDHVHFVCDKCHNAFCLDATKIPTVILPENFTADSYQMIVRGICSTCSR
jgi:Fur family transcriptional regulator, ferric uptake regulator